MADTQSTSTPIDWASSSTLDGPWVGVITARGGRVEFATTSGASTKPTSSIVGHILERGQSQQLTIIDGEHLFVRGSAATFVYTENA